MFEASHARRSPPPPPTTGRATESDDAERTRGVQAPLGRPRSIASKILGLLAPAERRQVFFLLPVVVAMALLQVVGIASILPFLQLAGNPEALHASEGLTWLYDGLGFASERSFLFFLGVLAFVMLTFSNAFRAYTTWRIARFSYLQSHRLSLRLLARYLDQPYVFFLGRNTSDLSKRILSDVQQIVSGILMPGLQTVAQMMTTALLFVFLVMIDPLLAGASALVLGGAYLSIYVGVRRTVSRIGRENLMAHRFRYQYTYEALHGIKETKILGKEPSFLAQFAAPSEQAARNSALNQILSSVPRYALEVIGFGGILLIVLYLLAAQRDLGQALPLIGVYALASYRLLPALQQIFSSFTKMRFNVATLDAILEDTGDVVRDGGVATGARQPETPPMTVRDKIELRHVSFGYPGASEPLVRDLELSIEAKTSVGLVGATGSGKTTVIDIVLGLLRPSGGALLVDGLPIDDGNLANWQRTLGYVPQHIYLSDASIARNIAFGVPQEQIDLAAVERAAKVANLHDFIVSDLRDGYQTVVGDRGIRLSGGQRQRIGIARALYHDPAVLILDEATSALDGVTEESVLQAVEALANTKTIIMVAHRLTTIRNCDVIFMMERGRVVASGSYRELMDSETGFRAMAQVGTTAYTAGGSVDG